MTEVSRHYTFSGTPLLWTPWGPGEVSCIERCPHFRGIRFLVLSGRTRGSKVGIQRTFHCLYKNQLRSPLFICKHGLLAMPPPPPPPPEFIELHNNTTELSITISHRATELNKQCSTRLSQVPATSRLISLPRCILNRATPSSRPSTSSTYFPDSS